jgi:hypothetical protein
MRALVLASLLVVPRLATADDARAAPSPVGTQPVRVAVDAAPCDEDAVFRELARRVPNVRPASPGEPASNLEVEIARDGARLVGRLRVVAGGATTATRTISGRSCEEVVPALGLMAALALASEGSAADGSPPDTRGPSHETREAEPSPATAGPVSRSLWRLAAGGQAWGAATGAAGGGVFVEASGSDRRMGEAGPPATSYRLSASIGVLGTTAGPVEGTVTWRLLDLDACPFPLAVAARWSVTPCASLEGGSIEASARGVDAAQTVTRPWFAPGARLRLDWAPSDAVLIGLDAAVMVPLTRDTFEVGPALRVFQAPPINAILAAWAGLRFF